MEQSLLRFSILQYDIVCFPYGLSTGNLYFLYWKVSFICLLIALYYWKQHKCFIVATCDRDLKRRIRKVRLICFILSLPRVTVNSDAQGLLSSWQIPGVPIMYITQHKYSIERLPEATIGGGRPHVCCCL